jgi:hypothetical protein
MDMPETNPELGRAILEVVENQIRDNDPPETRQTIDRLVEEGYTAEEARRLVSTTVTVAVPHFRVGLAGAQRSAKASIRAQCRAHRHFIAPRRWE